MTARVLVRRATAALTLAFVAACGSDDNTGPSGTYTIAAPTASVAVAAGTGGTATISLNRTSNFLGTVQLSIDNLPAGVHATITPTTSLSNQTTAQVTFSVDPGTAIRTDSITIRGTSTGLADQTATVKINITGQPSYTIDFPAITLPPEGSKTFKVAVNRLNGFAGVVDVQFADLPAGVVGTFATISGPGTGSGDSALVTLTAGPVTGSCVSNSPPSGTRTIHLRSYNASLDTLTSVELTIPDVPSFNTSVANCAPRLSSPDSVQYTVTLNRFGGLTAPISVFAVGLPTGVTTDTITTTGNTAVVTVRGSNAALGTAQTIQIRSITAGLATRNANATLNVTGLLRNGVIASNLAGPLSSFRYYRVNVPEGATKLVIQTGTTTGTASGTDIDIAVRAGALPDYNNGIFDCIAETASAAESCTISDPTPGDYYLLIIGFTAYSGIQALATVTVPDAPPATVRLP
jgi:hypothetical protein